LDLKTTSRKSLPKSVLIRGIGEMLSLSPAADRGARQVQEPDLGRSSKQAMIVEEGVIRWTGPERKLQSVAKGRKFFREFDLQNRLVLPAFVECHTHTLHAGSRAHEFEQRVAGRSYQEIAKAGGGILSTVRATRKASEAELLHLAQVRADEFLRQGVTTLEIKSGYGLDTKTEIKMLRAAGKLRGPRIVRTYLGPHAISPETGSAEDDLRRMLERDLPLVKKNSLACRVDIFVEQGYFQVEQARRYAQRAQELGFDLVVHADQLSRSGGAHLAVEQKARSAEHLICINDEDIRALAASQVSCVLLPAADLYLKCSYPPARALIDAGARVALATDYNPGSSPTQSLSLVGVLARLEMKMSLPEVIAAYTIGAAHALGLESSLGALTPGRLADFVVMDCDWDQLFYQIGPMPVESVWREGRSLSKN